MDFSDMQITANEYFDILRKAWENSPYFDGWERKWHPEDLYFNFDTVARGVGEGLAAYTHVVGAKVRADKFNLDKSENQSVDEIINKIKKQAAEERVQVFGGTLPKNYNKKDVPPTYTGNNVFGDNV